MRHSLNFGLLNLTEDSDESIEANLPKAAIAELKKKAGTKVHPASFLINEALDKLESGAKFSVSDFYILMHWGQDEILVKMPTLRSNLSNLARKTDGPIEVANSDARHRIYRKK